MDVQADARDRSDVYSLLNGNERVSIEIDCFRALSPAFAAHLRMYDSFSVGFTVRIAILDCS